MTDAAASAPTRLERAYDASIEDVWDLWTTAAGIEEWWSPDGFVTHVRKLDLRPGGVLIHAMTAIGAAQVEFMTKAGLPLTNVGRKRFVEISRPSSIAYTSLIDFVPGVEPYDHLTVVELTRVGRRVAVVMTIDRLHDDDWTGRMIAGRTNELENLARAIARRGAA